MKKMSEIKKANSQQITVPKTSGKETNDVNTQPTPGTEESAIYQIGIDVSSWQGQIDWTKVAKAGVKHAFIKMTEGVNYVDSRFYENWNGAKKAGISVNCYHYFRALDSAPEKQMQNIKKNSEAVSFDPTQNILAIDVEEIGNKEATPVQMADGLNALLNLLMKDSIFSCRPIMIYTSSNYWNSKVMWDKYNFGVCHLWVAHWETQNPRLPQPWEKLNKSWTWWQYSAKGKLDGIKGDVDLDWVKV